MARGANSILGRGANSEAFFGAERMAQKLQAQSAIDKNFFIKVGRVARGAWRMALGVWRKYSQGEAHGIEFFVMKQKTLFQAHFAPGRGANGFMKSTPDQSGIQITTVLENSAILQRSITKLCCYE